MCIKIFENYFWTESNADIIFGLDAEENWRWLNEQMDWTSVIEDDDRDWVLIESSRTVNALASNAFNL